MVIIILNTDGNKSQFNCHWKAKKVNFMWIRDKGEGSETTFSSSSHLINSV